jgi:hypothetical protein
VTSSFFWCYAFGLFSLGLCERLCVQPKIDYTGELEATADVTKDMLQRVRQDVDCKWDVCRATDGAHCEMFRTQQLFHMCVNKIVSVDE